MTATSMIAPTEAPIEPTETLGRNSEDGQPEISPPSEEQPKMEPVVKTKKNTLSTDKVLPTMNRIIEMSSKKRKLKVQKEVDGKVKEILANIG